MWLFRKSSDDEHIERLRRELARLDRLRPWIIAFFAIMTVAYVWLLVKIGQSLNDFGQPPNNGLPNNNPLPNNIALLNWAGFMLGASFGAVMGLIALKLIHGLMSFVLGRRSERLLVKYHDAFREAQQMLADSAFDENRGERY
jgi:hypothetical protein